MHVLLPPSEGKTPGGRGTPIARRTASAASEGLAAARERVLLAVESLAAGPRDATVAALSLPAGAADTAIAANAAARDARTRKALERYAGVVYDGLAATTLTPAAQRLAGRQLWIFSGLFGVVRGDEPIPDYRVPASAALPGIGIAATFWRPVLDEVMPRLLRRGLVVDLRSTDYLAMWRPPAAIRERVVSVRVLSPLPKGGVGVVSYPSKFAKGRLAAALLERSAAGLDIETVDDVAAAWRDATALPATVIDRQRLEINTA